jgi:hypothetical protein
LNLKETSKVLYIYSNDFSETQEIYEWFV